MSYLLESLHSAAVNEVVIWLLDAPVDLAVQLSGLRHTKVVLLAVEIVKQGVQASSDVPAPLQHTWPYYTLCMTTVRAASKKPLRRISHKLIDERSEIS